MSTEGDDVVVKRIGVAGQLTGTAMQAKARRIVYKYIVEHRTHTSEFISFDLNGVYVVWFSKTLQNWKALLNTTLSDGMYYEVTYDGDRKRSYLDAYKRSDNIMIPDRDL
jgi:hypothetical protein